MLKKFTNHLGNKQQVWILLLGIMMSWPFQGVFAQCTNTSSFGSANAPTTPTPVTITTCAFAGEYSTINNAVAGNTYLFTATGGAGNYITVRQGTSSGVALGFGTSPISVTCTVSGPLFLHFNTNSTCGTDGSCHTGTVSCTNCAAPTPPANDNCSSATVLTSSPTCSPVSGTNVNATQSLASITCAGFTSSSALDVWYSFTATATTHTVTVVGGTGFDAIIDVRSGACNGTNIGCADATISGGTEATTVNGLTVGQTYYVRVYGWAGGTGSFTICVTAPVTPPSITCPTAGNAAACQTQAAVNTAFAAWLATASGSGGCGGVLTNNNSGAPSACGGSTTVTFTYTSTCAPLTTTCQATFTVAAPRTVILTCPTNLTVAAGQTQTAVNTQFDNWLATASASGGCNGVLTNNNLGAPSAVNGGSTTVTFTYTSTCAPLTTTCQATFTVATGSTVVLNCPSPITAAACQTQAAVNTQFANWLATATSSGGCNGVLTNNNTGAPPACGGSTTVTFTYTSTCAPLTTTCQATFTVAAAPTVVLTCPVATTASACLTQAQLNTQYATWLASATASGGCNGSLSNDGGAAPLICSATAVTKTVTFTYTSSCSPLTTTCTSTFTVPAYPTFTVPANGASTVACPANATQPTPPTVLDGCSKTLTPTGPVITNNPTTITCEGTRTYAWTYTDCAGRAATWSYVYTIERNPFTVPANGASTVACPANATQPTPPVVLSNCGETLTPTGPVVTNSPNPLTCEGTRTYAWTYTDCEGNTATWSYVYTIERQPFAIPANGGSTVSCPAQTDVPPTPPTVVSGCGEAITPVLILSAKPTCEGTRVYAYQYTDCEGNLAEWKYIYTVERNDFTVPANVVLTAACPLNATAPVPPTVTDNCGNELEPDGPTVTGTANAQGCESSRVYSYVYKDCEGNSHTWSTTYNFMYTEDFFAPQDEEAYVTCLAYAVPPAPQTLFDNCGSELKVSGPSVDENISAGGCSGWRKFSYVYTDCGGHSHPWNFTYYINDNEGPLGTCPNSTANGAVTVNVSNLGCIEDVPCPEDYDFTEKIEDLIEAGDYFDACSGGNISVTLDSYTDLWECSDPDGNGVYTFGRTFYFVIADACGNKAESLCAVTYSGNCLPMESFGQGDWGINGGQPGDSQEATDLQLIGILVNPLNPITIGGGNRSLKVDDAQCVTNLLPGTGGPDRLGNCHQVNCSNGCNPLGIGGLKNSLAANAIALELNIRYNIRFNNLTRAVIRSQGLRCVGVSPDILYCDANGGNCKLRVFDQNGVLHEYPYTVGGLQDFANFFLGGNLLLSKGASYKLATALNQSLLALNAYWSEEQFENQCQTQGGIVSPGQEGEKSNGQLNNQGLDVFSLAPNPAGTEVNLRMVELDGAQEVSFELRNTLGQLVLRREFGQISYLSEHIDISTVGNGLYIASLSVGKTLHELKLVVSKD